MNLSGARSASSSRPRSSRSPTTSIAQNKEIPEHILKQMAELGYFGVIFPGRRGRHGPRLHLDGDRHRRVVARMAQRRLGDDAQHHHRHADQRQRHARAEKEIPAADRARRDDDRGRIHRARFGQRHGVVQNARGQAWRRLPDQGLEDVVHVRQSRAHADRDDAHRPGHVEAAQGTVADPVREEAGRRLHAAAIDRLADSHHRLPRDAQLRAAVRRRVRAGGEPDRRASKGAASTS